MPLNGRRYGFNIFSKPVEDILQYSVENNIDYIEIHLSAYHASIDSFTSKRIDNLLNITQDNNISLGLHLPQQINVSDILPIFRKNNLSFLSDCISLAETLQAESITMHMGNYYWFPVERWMRKKALKRLVGSLEQTIEQCEKSGVLLALENVVPIPQGSEYHYLGDNIDDFHFVFDQLNSDCIKFCLDTGHANMAEGISEYILNFEDKIVSVHYHDNLGLDDEHLPVGKGNIDWDQFAKAMIEINFTGPFISECRELKPHESAAALDNFFHLTRK